MYLFKKASLYFGYMLSNRSSPVSGGVLFFGRAGNESALKTTVGQCNLRVMNYKCGLSLQAQMWGIISFYCHIRKVIFSTAEEHSCIWSTINSQRNKQEAVVFPAKARIM